jgi:imidazolonepropionase-like amidohydrolase
VTVDGGLIASIAPASSERAPGALVVDGRGKTLLPGLVDLHVHSTMSSAPPWYLVFPSPEHNLQAHLHAGTTTILDMGGSIDDLLVSRMNIARGRWLGPRLYYAGPIITAPGGYPASMIREVYGALADAVTSGKLTRQVRTPEEATLAVREAWARGASIIKVAIADIPRGAPRLSEETLRAIVQQATELDLKVAAHIDTADDALLAARVGVRIFAHGVTTGPITPEQVQVFKNAGVSCTPTLVNFELFTLLAKNCYVPGAVVARSEDPDLLAQFGKEQVAEGAAKLSAEFFSFGKEIESHLADRSANTKMMFDAGIPILVGTDANGSVGSFPGNIHDELKLLVDSGIPPAEVLLGATSRAARFLDKDASYGTIEVGKCADLLLVDGNPVEDIQATQRIVEVIVRGVPLERTP